MAARSLGANEKWLDVVISRLPRLPTDQTATLARTEADDPVLAMLAAVRATVASESPYPRHEGTSHV